MIITKHLGLVYNVGPKNHKTQSILNDFQSLTDLLQEHKVELIRKLYIFESNNEEMLKLYD